ncbi:hypothetical protein DDB_G0289411 [Dictyostelium discoideum AX4]|uniref:Uncharacterized protein n=1 Tax=Dictyostelium discoideum TaxID=44689 RepID=Q54HJ4_DICDI|nr:hypothetical protein DDB_G0289411 [Dictyostelium discoideum AX4]EAL62733.1 hypothetical protein DDB_G0289411 [Dictyostelium discoideum AX4]|eukprot:XP_636239.1 hypothetical protein DDB_G0289411 [Dictyostelium discoideum AX4]
MKFLAILLILISILGLSSAITVQHINARIFCGRSCSNPEYTDISINVNQCTVLSKEATCNYALPYITVSPNINSLNSSYIVSASIGCGMATLTSKTAYIGICNPYTISGVEFSVYADPPIDGASSSNSLKPMVLFSAFVFFIISLIL